MWVIDNQQFLGKLDGWDRAAQFADGLFETMVVKNQNILGLKYHVARMEKGIKQLGILNFEHDLSELFESYAHSFCDLSKHKDGVLKVIVSRGESQRGYAYDHKITPRITAFYNEYPFIAPEIYQKGIKLVTLKTQCSINPQLAGLKHLNRLENVLAKAELSSNAYEGLMTNYLGNIIEGTMSNVFFEENGQLFTPDLTLSGVEGVLRECVIEYANKCLTPVRVLDIKTAETKHFKQGFICNSVLGIVPIASLDQADFTLGDITKRLVSVCVSGEIYE